MGAALYFMLTFRPPREDFFTTMSEDEKQIVKAHLEYLAELQDQGKVKFAGRDQHAAFGVAIVKVASLEEAEAIVARNPAVAAGLYTCDLARYTVPLE